MNKALTKNKTATVAWRFYVVLFLVVFIYGSLLARSAYIQIIEPDALQKRSNQTNIRVATHKEQRGSILDRNGRELAISVPVETVWADPKVVMEKDGLSMVKHWKALADVLDQDVKKITSKVLRSPTKRFVYIQRQVSPAMADYIKKLKIPGIYLRKESKRYYPAGEVSAHIVGFTNVDDKGIEGIEKVYDKLLTGKDGKKTYRKDAKGRKIEILSEQKSTKPQDLNLSIDQRIQSLAYKELKGAVKAFKARSGSVVVTNVHTGEILALVNSPSYNPNNRRNTPIHRFRNRAITDFYEPGSTMKPLVVVSALENGSVNKNSVINTSPGRMRLGGRTVSDPHNLGKLSLTDILVHSSNMGTTKLALGIPQDFYLQKFFEAGFGELTGLNLIGESSGIMHSRRRWSKFELATLSYGMGVSTTPVQLARFYSTLANGGMKKPLTILKQTQESQNSMLNERIFSEKNALEVVGMLENVVDEHVKNAQVDGYRVGGKTGTAFKALAGGYGNDYVGLFAGMAPIKNPEIVVVVVINEPGGDLYHGGEVAAPVFSRVMKGSLRLLNIAPEKNMQTAFEIQKQDSGVNDA